MIGMDCTCLNSVISEPVVPTIPVSEQLGIVPEQGKDDLCGLCSSTSCLCQDLGLRPTPLHIPESIISSDSSTQGTKRKLSKQPATMVQPSATESFPMEIDFTSVFASVSQRDDVPVGGCGFCSDSTPCVCRTNTLPPLLSDSSSIIHKDHPKVVRRNSGKRPQIEDIRTLTCPGPLVDSFMTIASGNSGCTGEPGAQEHRNISNCRDMLTMPVGSDVDIILSDLIKKIRDSGIFYTDTTSANQETCKEMRRDIGYVPAL